MGAWTMAAAAGGTAAVLAAATLGGYVARNAAKHPWEVARARRAGFVPGSGSSGV